MGRSKLFDRARFCNGEDIRGSLLFGRVNSAEGYSNTKIFCKIKAVAV